jgi:hypothetical protein
MKRERIEDLGVIRERLSTLLRSFFDEWPYFDSKHSYERFKEHQTKDDCQELATFHTALRFFKDELWGILSIANGEEEGEE